MSEPVSSSKDLIFAALALLLVGCNPWLNSAAVERAKEACVANGGIRIVKAGVFSQGDFSAICNNGLSVSGGTGNGN